jgi:hypothetical protein
MDMIIKLGATLKTVIYLPLEQLWRPFDFDARLCDAHMS